MEKPAPAEYPIQDAIKQRWSPRSFSSRMVEPEKLRSLLEAARWAPSSYNEQPWYFLVATKDDEAEYQKMLECLVEFNQQWAYLAPVLMISGARGKFEKNGQPNRHAFHDVGLAVANMIFEATALGLFVHQMAGFSPERVKELYNVPEDFEPVAAIAIGYAGEVDDLPEDFREKEIAPRERKPLESFVFQGAWGQPSRLVSQREKALLNNQ
ncbi:MAG: nitroreductase family protein [Pyrinomonadaceae bacterium]